MPSLENWNGGLKIDQLGRGGRERERGGGGEGERGGERVC